MKTMKKLLSLVLVCVMLVGAISAFGVTASAEDQTIAIVGKNVYYGETLQLMYAVDAPVLNDGDEVKVTLYADEACTLKFCDAYANGTTTVNGVKCTKFYASKGVPAQDINLVVYAKAEIVNNGTTVASTVFAYSVLQYFNELYYKTTNDNLKALATSIIAYAKALEVVIYNTEDKQANRVSAPVANNNYVAVDANVLGVAQGMYVANSTPFANVATDLVAGEGEAIAWTVTDLDTGLATVYDLDSLKALTLTANVKVSVAVVEGTVEPEPTPVILTIAEALALADDEAVIVTGTVCEINYAWSDSYGNMSATIADAEGNVLYMYKLASKVAIGDIIVVTGTMDTYGGARQVAAGATAEIVGTCAHETTTPGCAAAPKCTICGTVTGEMVDHVDANGDEVCDTCGKDMSASAPVEETESMKIVPNSKTSFDEANEIATWVGSNVTFTLEQGTNTSNKVSQALGYDVDKNLRIYKGHQVTVNCAGMTKIVITASASKYVSPLQTSAATIAGATVTTNGNDVVIEFATAVDSVAFYASAQIRVNNIAVTYTA